jgi:hypothetical protein
MMTRSCAAILARVLIIFGLESAREFSPPMSAIDKWVV